jgi:hypothetical protein
MDNPPQLLEILSTVPGWLAVLYLLVTKGGSALGSRPVPKSDSGKIERIADDRLRRAGLPVPSPTPTESQRLARIEARIEALEDDKRRETSSLAKVERTLRDLRADLAKENLPNASTTGRK